MARPPRWKEDGIKDGIGVVRLFSWKYFPDYIYQRMLDYETHIWRGQRCSNWELTSTLDRIIEKSKMSHAKRSSFVTKHLDEFKYATRGRRGENPPQ